MGHPSPKPLGMLLMILKKKGRFLRFIPSDEQIGLKVGRVKPRLELSGDPCSNGVLCKAGVLVGKGEESKG